MPQRRNGLGSHQVAPRPRRPGHRHCRGLWPVPGLANGAGIGRSGILYPPVRSRRLPGREPPHGRQLVLGLGSHAGEGRLVAGPRDSGRPRAAMLDEAQGIHDEDRQVCRAIGRHGRSCSQPAPDVLTHCNAGGLATAEYGTALAVFFTAQEQGKRLHVYVDETRPLLQGARLTAWELTSRGIAATLICDSMAAQVMREGRVQAVVTGADRIAANGDTANKIGTYSLAVLANAHGIPFYVAAPVYHLRPDARRRRGDTHRATGAGRNHA